MRAPSPGETELLVPLYEGVFEQPMWQTFLSRLRAATGASFASIAFRPPESDEVVELASDTDALSPLTQLFVDTYGHTPLPDRTMREGRVYSLDEIMENGDQRGLAFYREYMVPRGFDHMLSVRVREPGGLDAWLGVTKSRKPFGAAASQLLSALVPHVRAALRTFAAIERERMRSSVSAEAFRRMNFGWISIDARCRIIDMDSQAELLMKRSPLLRRGRYDRLTPSSPALDRELTEIVRQFQNDRESRPRAINLSRDPWIDMLVAPVRLDTYQAGSRPVAVVYLSGDRTSTADRCEQLATLFNLTGSEAKLAWAMAQGLSIAEAASDLGITVETARNYSKKIYAKTGARGQSDLVRHILTSVLALA